MELFECKVRYQREMGDGKLAQKREVYLIEAISFGDAETRVLEEVRPFAMMGQEIEMQAIKKVKFAEILPSEDGQYWFKAKVMLTSIDENAGKEKKIAVNMLVHALDMETAHAAVHTLMKGSVTDYTVTNLQETEIVDVISLVKNA